MKSIDSTGIHIISFDVPFPYNYGGVIDVYHRCKALQEEGVRVVLHCYEYGRGETSEINKIADEVYYYKRDTNPFLLLSPIPFIVRSRAAYQLLKNLQKDTYPILFEGLHTCYFLGHKALRNRWKGVRAHNVEHDYYAELAKVEPSWKKRLFFKLEAIKLKNFERVFHYADAILSVTPKDNEYFQKTYQKGTYIPVFNPLNWGEKKRGTGDYALFHGNLSVIENENAVRYLVNEIWETNFDLQLKIAGKDPSSSFLLWLKKQNMDIECIPNPDNLLLNQLICEAKINLLPTFQNTGIKHKLLNALANGGYCIANTTMVEGTGLEDLCTIANTPKEWKATIRQLSKQENDEEVFDKRVEVLRSIFDLSKNAQKIMGLVNEI
jgi:hypothetical protein